MKITSFYRVSSGTLITRSIPEIKNEPMLFNCDFAAANELGGPLTDEFISLLPDDWKNIPLVIDSRTHMLMPGWYPCIPGWHHDDVPRTRADGQPNYDEGQLRSEHIMALVGGEICATEFAVGEVDLIVPKLGKTIYEDWDRDVELLVNNGAMTRESVPTNRLIHFDDRAFHRGTPAIASGWRWFIRASRYFDKDGNPVDRPNPRTNEIRKQSQVYMPTINAGW
jgi:hypothetical protein